MAAGRASILAPRGDGTEVVGLSGTGEEAAALVERSNPDVVITQLEHRLEEAQEVLSRIRSADSKIVVLSMFYNLHYLKGLSKLGIDAYVHKSSSAEELVATTGALSRDASGGNVVVSMPPGACSSGSGRSRRGSRRGR